ncbi:MAG TPA: peroxiredoxin [Moraxellaceae bacterium]|nr:peroxiredoxin [Moraxellaceae bacterium]
MALAIGDSVPDFRLPATSNKEVLLSALRGWHVVLYFYPKDSTPGCTLEGQVFRDMFNEFKAEKCMILGVSRDSLKSHENFKEKQCFPFELITDANEELCRLFDVIRMKNMYGKMVEGIERSTFLIDKEGVLRAEWRKVKVEGHGQEVLAAVRQLNA